MYAIRLQLQPSGAMTFRKLPGSILDIATYPFVPPTTMSGFLRRVMMMAAGLPLPETKANTKDTPFFAMPRNLVVTGALPGGLWGVHRTRRKGPSNFKHTAFSQILTVDRAKSENIQLHSWEYFHAECMEGFVLADEPTPLAELAACKNWGCKIGKEGFAIVSEVSEPFALTNEVRDAIPSTLLSAQHLPIEALRAPLDYFTLYQYVYKETEEDPAPQAEAPTPIQGYKPLQVAQARPSVPLRLEYWHNQSDVHIPAAWVEVLQGGAP